MRFLLFASFICCFCCLVGCKNRTAEPGITDNPCLHFECESGAIVRGDTGEKKLALVFTGDEYADGGRHILSVLKNQQIPGSFFLTGNFYRIPGYYRLIKMKSPPSSPVS